MSFVRFVFTILIAGMAVNLTLVLLANSASHKRQLGQTEEQQRRLADLLAQADDRVRRLDLVVESQHVLADDSVPDSTLVLRQYRSVGTDQSEPLPVQRLVIPGNRIQVGGLALEFTSTFPPPPAEQQEFPFLKNKTLLYFSTVCGTTPRAPDRPTTDERFTFTPGGQPPQLTRIDPLTLRPTYFETHLWGRIWSDITMPGATLPATFAATGGEKATWMKVTWMKPAERTLRRGHTYTAYISTEGMTLDEDKLPSIPNLMKLMLDEARELSDEDTSH